MTSEWHYVRARACCRRCQKRRSDAAAAALRVGCTDKGATRTSEGPPSLHVPPLAPIS